jgi:L-serine dehydratase
MGPGRAAEIFHRRAAGALAYRVHLFGSLAATGRGHMTDAAIREALQPQPVEFVWEAQTELPLHPNGMRFEALDAAGQVMDTWEVYSVGGGALRQAGQPPAQPVYPMTTMAEILKYCTQSGKALWEVVEENEDPEIWVYLAQVWEAMQAAIERGLNAEGALPGGLGLARKAWAFYRQIGLSGGKSFLSEGFLPAYALAVSEENASGGVVVTAPTCGSSGVLPAVLRHVQEHVSVRPQSVLRALATAGLIGNLVKTNASISGAEVGCQGEVGVACAMAAGAAAQLLGGTARQVEYAAEMGLEHHLGLTCDPVDGLVQIPCIERNVFAAARAVSCARYAAFTDGSHRVSFDEVVAVMQQTGHDLPHLYRETAGGGLAKAYRFPPQGR